MCNAIVVFDLGNGQFCSPFFSLCFSIRGRGGWGGGVSSKVQQEFNIFTLSLVGGEGGEGSSSSSC